MISVWFTSKISVTILNCSFIPRILFLISFSYLFIFSWTSLSFLMVSFVYSLLCISSISISLEIEPHHWLAPRAVWGEVVMGTTAPALQHWQQCMARQGAVMEHWLVLHRWDGNKNHAIFLCCSIGGTGLDGPWMGCPLFHCVVAPIPNSGGHSAGLSPFTVLGQAGLTGQLPS